jgi:hypothetical protein
MLSEMAEIDVLFDPADAPEGLRLFLPALAEKGVLPRSAEVSRSEDKWGTLASAEAVGFTMAAAHLAVVLRPVLMLWLGRGKRVYIKNGSQEVVLENLSGGEIDQVLSSIDADGR